MTDLDQLPTRLTSVMEDPSARAIARTYADAFLNAAASAEGGAEAAVEEYQSFVNDVLVPHPEFANLLTSGILGPDERLGVVDRVVGPRASQRFTGFLQVLARHDRLDLLPLILEETKLRHEERTGRKRVTVTSAQPLTEETLREVTSRLDASLPFTPIVTNTVDATIIGGLIIQIGDTVYDSSLRNRLNQLSHRLSQRSLHEIQSGRDRFCTAEGD